MPNPMPAPAPVTRTTWSWKSNMAGLSVQDEHGLAREPPGHQVLGHLTDLLPRPLQADVRCQLSGGHELGEPTEADRCGPTAEFREDIEAVEGRASRDEELSCVEGDLGGGRDAERDADASPLQGSQRGPECSSAHRLDDEIVLGLARDLVAHHHVGSAQLAHSRCL